VPLEFSSVPADPAAYLPQRAGGAPPPVGASGTLQAAVDGIVNYIAGRGFNFQTWQVAAFVTAVRTKPFVILAGISGTGKTKLPQLVAEATGAECRIVPVRPDWTDSSDLLGYERLDGKFSRGHLLQLCREAAEFPGRQYFFVLDEMNIARVEYYFAEVLSALETRIMQGGVLVSEPLSPRAPPPWEAVRLPANVCVVGTVNMDETTHGFSRKVLDRAFVIELADVDLSLIQEIDPNVAPAQWPITNWQLPFSRLAKVPKVDQDPRVAASVTALTAVNEVLEGGQLQVGYRVRDEVALFCVNASDCADSFVDADETVVSPLDLCITMKVLPRIQGGGALVRQVLEGMKALVAPDADTATNAEFAQTLKRVDLMLTRLAETGFTSYWM
jgi:dynein-related subfamily AAA family protein